MRGRGPGGDARAPGHRVDVRRGRRGHHGHGRHAHARGDHRVRPRAPTRRSRPRSPRPSARASAASTCCCARRWTCTPACARARATPASAAATRTSTWSSSARTPRTSTPASSSRRASPPRPSSSTTINRLPTDKKIKTGRDTTGVSIKPISVENTRRIVKYAFEYARANGRKKVTAVHKANIMKFTDGLFKAVAEEVAEEYPRHRVRGAAGRQHVHAARAEARAVRRARAAEPLRRHPVATCAPGWWAGWAWRPGANIGDERRGLRGHPRLRPQVQGPEQGQPDGR